jgi:hypothetical protein
VSRVAGIDGSVRDCRVLRGLLAGRPLAVHHTFRLQLSR